MITTIATIIMDVGLGAVALRLAYDLRKLVNIHEGRIAALEKHTGMVLT